MEIEEDIIEAYVTTELPFEVKLHAPYWEVVLSDGVTVYSHPNRRSWMELKQYLKENPHQHIVELHVVFRDNRSLIHRGTDNYFLCHNVVGLYGGPSKDYLIAGYQDGPVVRTKKYMLPEVYMQEEGERSLDDASVQKGLIINDDNIQTS
jgi:hypothetical protein